MKTGVLNYAEWDPQKRKVLFEIREDISIDIPGRESLNIPIGYKTDFASIPWWFRWAIPSVGKHSIAALVHDYLYDEQIGTRAESDKIFLDVCRSQTRCLPMVGARKEKETLTKLKKSSKAIGLNKQTRKRNPNTLYNEYKNTDFLLWWKAEITFHHSYKNS